MANTKKPEKKQAASELKKTIKKATGPTIDVYDLNGKLVGKESVEKDIFQAKINHTLEALAVRVYLVNQRQGTVSTKTRGEVKGSTKKLYRQKGTGRARQGGRRAPHRVGGGIVFGPKPRMFKLSLPKKIKSRALFSALSSKFKEGRIIAVNNMAGIEPKTKMAAKMLEQLPAKGSMLLITGKDKQNITRSTRNLKKVTCLPVADITAYAVLANNWTVFSSEALKELINVRLSKGNNADK